MKIQWRFLLYLFFCALPITAVAQNSIFRGPYLQKATTHSIVLRWMTSHQAGSKVSFGFSPNNYVGTRFDTTFTWDHTIELTGLLPATKYYYSIETMDSVLMEGAQLYFETLPESGTVGDYSFLVLGDAGQGSPQQREVSLALQNVYGNHHDGLILLGDNAYGYGTQEEYQYKFFDGFYEEIIENTVIWPAPGNHDYYGASIPMTTTAPYFDIFNLPTQGESGGVPSLTEQFYSYDYGNIHFLSLDSYAVDRADTSYMADWIRADLEANTLPWVIAYWHHPPYSKGSHNSDTEIELVQMRENLVPILEYYNVDLVLCGHSHSYERSVLISNHYGPSQTFGPEHIRSASSGNYPAQCPYYKFTDSLAPTHQGTVYSVVGVSGWLGNVCPDWPHPIMYSHTNKVFGGMRIRVQGNELTAEFLTDAATVYDRFMLVKDADVHAYETECVQTYETDWTLYPNPANNEIFLQKLGASPKPEDTYTILDAQGRLIRTGSLEEVTTIDLRSEQAGVYFILVREKAQIGTIRFVKL